MRHPRIRCVLIAVVIACLSAGVSPVQARTDTRDKPVILVHGFDVAVNPGTSCAATWGDLERAFRSWGHTGPIVTLAYYAYDSECDHSIDHHGGHDRHYASGHNAAGHTADTDIRHLGYHLAWYLWAHWSSAGRPVDLVGHSMGGLIIRYALAQVERGHPDFPTRLLVEDIVTLGTPHAGTRYALACAAVYRQCAQMRPGSGFMGWLATNAPEPDGEGGTDWSVLGSYDDELVSPTSAMAMSACHKVAYLGSSNVNHTEYPHLTSDTPTADARHRDCPTDWRTSYNYPWPVRRTDRGVTFGAY